MYDLILKLILISALAQLGFQLSEAELCLTHKCSTRLERASRDILCIDWKPISVWPEIGGKFK